MNKNDCKLLYTLYLEGCLDSFQSITASSLCKITEFGGTKVRKTLNEFIENGYVSEGLKKSQARTFYITKEGIEHLKKILPADMIKEQS